MLVKLENPLLLSKAVELISELVTEVRIKVNEFGMSITAMDPANVSMVNFKVPKSAFSEFNLEDSKNQSEILGVNLDNLKKVLKRAGSGSSVILKRKDNTLDIQIDDKIKRDFNLGLIEIESEDKEMPTLDYSAKVEINSEDLIASIEDCSVVSDACSFIIENKKFIIEAKGLNSARAEFSDEETRIETGEDFCKSRYSLEYLIKFIKGAKLTEKTILRFASDHPLKMDLKTEHMEISFILAPRVENDD
jgi:proliferating cell nuclear antigen